MNDTGDTGDTGSGEESVKYEDEIVSASELAGEKGGVSCSHYSPTFSFSYFVILGLVVVYCSLIKLNLCMRV